jgi:hypothetical protein
MTSHPWPMKTSWLQQYWTRYVQPFHNGSIEQDICSPLTNAMLNEVHATLALQCVITLNTDYIQWNINETTTSKLCFLHVRT